MLLHLIVLYMDTGKNGFPLVFSFYFLTFFFLLPNFLEFFSFTVEIKGSNQPQVKKKCYIK